MVLLFSSFLVAFISNQRKKLQYHKDLQTLNEQQQEHLKEQNALLEQRVAERTTELSRQKDALQTALADLESSQQLLIQKEKMASLGELTAGIAHEIQNPLNFVNNFAEINTELLVELKEKLESLPIKDNGDIQLLSNDITENLNKILLHGKRADSIVKNMLLHSRKQSGDMELTALNELADEYLKLSYHGYRAKNKAFNCTIHTSFDESIGRIPLIPQDIGRVLINLFNNAFYSTNEKKKKTGEDFVPAVSLTTQKKGDKILLLIEDNGLGIPQKIIDKIYHPFFTTKPTGEGTGLGLSMSYDIIKVHNGQMKVNSKEGEFASFVIELNA
jgi:signal transduction histidine kinase